MSKITTRNKSLRKIGGYYKYPFNQSKGSIFSLRPLTTDVNNSQNVTKWELLTDYLLRKHITRWYVNKFAYKKWIAVDSFKNRLYVCELCPDEIDEYLGIESRCDNVR